MSCGLQTQWNTTQLLQKNEIVPWRTICMEPEMNMLLEISHKAKDNQQMVSLMSGI